MSRAACSRRAKRKHLPRAGIHAILQRRRTGPGWERACALARATRQAVLRSGDTFPRGFRAAAMTTSGGMIVKMTQSGAADRAVTVAPQSGLAVKAGRGDLVRVVDLGGHQVGDMWAIDAADPGRWLSASHTRDRCERLFPAMGEQFCDQYGEPILQLAADTSPGVHDMLFPPCDPPLYEGRGLPGHPNCRDNFLAAAASAGIALPVVPDPVNLFQNSGPRPDGRLVIGTAASLPGQAISFLAQRDLVFVLTACSVDYPPLNDGRCSPLLIEITPHGRGANSQREN